jgi:hypothetical protein
MLCYNLHTFVVYTSLCKRLGLDFDYVITEHNTNGKEEKAIFVIPKGSDYKLDECISNIFKEVDELMERDRNVPISEGCVDGESFTDLLVDFIDKIREDGKDCPGIAIFEDRIMAARQSLLRNDNVVYCDDYYEEIIRNIKTRMEKKLSQSLEDLVEDEDKL